MSRQSTSAINTQLQLYMPGITILKNDFTKKKIERRKEEILKRNSMFGTMKMMRLFLCKPPRHYQI